MKLIKKLSVLSLMSLSSLGFAQYTAQWTEVPQQIELVSSQSVKNVANPINTEQKTVHFHHSLIGSEKLTSDAQGYLAESKQYWINTNVEKLGQGLQIPVTSDLAVIRINPLNPDKSSFNLNQQTIQVDQFDHQLPVNSFVNSQQLKAAGMPVSDRTVAFEINTQPGMLTLSMPGINKSMGKGDSLVIHVFEPNSDYVLQLKMDQQQFAANQTVKVQSQLLGTQKTHEMSIQGYVTQPNGEKVSDLNFSKTAQGDYQAQIDSLTGQSLAQGLWEIHTIASGEVNGLKVMRDVSSAFAVSLPTARFNQHLAVNQNTLKLGLDVSMAGRYDVSAVLSGFNNQGEQLPIAMLMSAAQLQKGQANLDLKLPQDLISESGLSGPFVVNQLNLKNQSLMVPVQQLDVDINLQPLRSINLTE